jgi:1-acyl-sn-glycerol-3-phosphate acyltransferase
MLYIRSFIYNVLFYVVLIGLMVFGLPILAMSRHATFWLARLWGKASIWMLDRICGTKVEFRNLHNIPNGAYIIAPKHQSIWETFALLLHAPDFSYVLKRELMWLPLFGQYLWSAEQIAINRSKGKSSLNQVVARARDLFATDRQLFIFPEGTRRPVGAPPAYKFGVAQVYGECGVPCLPVALNSGVFWPRRSFLRRPGTIVVDYLEPIAPGLSKQDFLTELQSRIETRTNELVAEAIARDPSLAALIASDAAGNEAEAEPLA